MHHLYAFLRRADKRRCALAITLCAAIAPAWAGNSLSGGMRLERGQSLPSTQGKYSLAMQTDGNLVMYRNDGTVRYRMGSNGLFAVMQTDGNFVEYNGMMAAVWNTGTWNNPGSILAIQDDGNLVVYSPSGTPLWNIGAEPEAKDPTLPGDVVGRKLNVPLAGFLGHLGLYDGKSMVWEADAGYQNAIQLLSLNQFKGLTDTYWGAASPNIPSGMSQKGCFLRYCNSANDFQQFEMRNAYGAYLVGADYTFTVRVTQPRWGNAISAPVRGVFRCDTFVLWALGAPLYAVSSPERNRWKQFIWAGVYANGVTPEITFNALKSYR
jgi:hypothetical protein